MKQFINKIVSLLPSDFCRESFLPLAFYLNRLVPLSLIALVPIFLFVQSCEKKDTPIPQPTAISEKPSGKIIAQVGDAYITDEMLQAEMRYRGGHIPGRFASSEEKQKLLDEIIFFEVLAQKAKKAGYDKQPEIMTALKKMMVNKYKEDQLEQLADRQRVSSQEIEEYYEKHPQEFSSTEAFRAAIIALKFNTIQTPAQKAQLIKQAETVRSLALKQKKESSDFGNLSSQYSDDMQTKYRGGRMDWILKNAKVYSLDPPVLKALFSLRDTIGEISPVVETESGYYLLKLMDYKPAKIRSFSAVREQIRDKLIQDKRNQFLQTYYQNAKKEMNIIVFQKELEDVAPSENYAKTGNEPPTFPIK